MFEEVKPDLEAAFLNGLEIWSRQESGAKVQDELLMSTGSAANRSASSLS